jgi:prophage regulatory protein
METEQPPDDRLIKIREVLRICGLSRSALYASIKKSEFPAQVKLSQRSSAWVHNEVVAWVRARTALRDKASDSSS